MYCKRSDKCCTYIGDSVVRRQASGPELMGSTPGLDGMLTVRTVRTVGTYRVPSPRRYDGIRYSATKRILSDFYSTWSRLGLDEYPVCIETQTQYMYSEWPSVYIGN